jgi:hypothetical protein
LLELVEDFGSQETYDRELGMLDPSSSLNQEYEPGSTEPVERTSGLTKFEELKAQLPGNVTSADGVEKY